MTKKRFQIALSFEQQQAFFKGLPVVLQLLRDVQLYFSSFQRSALNAQTDAPASRYVW